MEVILAPIDFSKGSDNAIEYAAHLSRLFSAKLVLYHVYHLPLNSFETGYIPPVQDIKLEVEEQVKKTVAKLQATFKNVEIEHEVEMGFAAEFIENASKRYSADLIVMGISGQNSLIGEYVMGSTSSKVAQNSKIPVLVIPDSVKYTKVKRIAYACDLDKGLEENTTLIKVKYFCALFDSELEILNVRKPREEVSVEKARTDKFVEEKFKTTQHHSFFIYDDKVDKGLTEFLAHEKIDIIISSPKKHGFFHNLFIETNTNKLIFHSPVPVLTIHE